MKVQMIVEKRHINLNPKCRMNEWGAHGGRTFSSKDEREWMWN